MTDCNLEPTLFPSRKGRLVEAGFSDGGAVLLRQADPMPGLTDRAEAARLHDARLDQFIVSFRRLPRRLLLDFDAAADPMHGMQEGQFFHGYHDRNFFCLCTFSAATGCIAPVATWRAGSRSSNWVCFTTVPVATHGGRTSTDCSRPWRMCCTKRSG